MRIHATKPLFAWDELETSPTLGVIREVAVYFLRPEMG